MKKFTFSFIAVIICLLNVSFPASATYLNVPSFVPESLAESRKATIDLSSETADVELDTNANVTIYSQNYYKTNSGKIKIKLASTTPTTVKVSLYDTSGNFIGGETKDVGKLIKTSWKFSSLTNSGTYYFTVKNLGQTNVTLTGTVTD